MPPEARALLMAGGTANADREIGKRVVWGR